MSPEDKEKHDKEQRRRFYKQLMKAAQTKDKREAAGSYMRIDTGEIEVVLH